MSQFQDHLPALRAWLRRRLTGEADVDDSLQDIWIRSHQHLRGGGIDNPEAYLFRTARSVVTDRIRRAQARQSKQHDPIEDFHHPVEGVTPERVLLGKEALAEAVARMALLPERTRDIFVLNRFEGLSYNEIAETMAISVSAVEKHIMKALRLLMEERG